MRTIAIVIPCFNEAKRLNFKFFFDLYAETHCSFIFVDDGSTDQTGQLIVETFLEQNIPVDLITFEFNLGKASAISRGLEAAHKKGIEFVAFCDADNSTKPSDILSLYEHIAENEHIMVVSGARVPLSGSNVLRRDFRKWVGRIVATLVSKMTHIAIYDPMSPMKVYRLNAFGPEFEFVPKTKWLGEVEIMFHVYNIDRSRFVVEEICLNYWRDEEGGHIGVKSVFVLIKDFSNLRKAIRAQGHKPPVIHRRIRGPQI